MQALAQAPIGALRLCLDQARAGWADEEAGNVPPATTFASKPSSEELWTLKRSVS